MSFNPPPNWPEPADPHWEPPAGWQPDSRWPAPPAGWNTRWEADTMSSTSAVAGAEDVPATSSRPLPAEEYPLTVDLPGNIRRAPAQSRAATSESTTSSPAGGHTRKKRTWTIIGALIGLCLIVATIVAFVWLYSFAMTSLPSSEALGMTLLPHEMSGTAGPLHG